MSRKHNLKATTALVPCSQPSKPNVVKKLRQHFELQKRFTRKYFMRNDKKQQEEYLLLRKQFLLLSIKCWSLLIFVCKIHYVTDLQSHGIGRKRFL